MKVKTLPKRVDAKAKFFQAKPSWERREKQNTKKKEDGGKGGESECERIHTQQTSREKGDDQLGLKQGT